MTHPIEYAGLMALAWDPLRGDTSGWEDRAFFLDRIQELGEPVLDVGCGTGRLLLDYRALGIDIDGVEIAPEMLAILRSKAQAAGLDVDGRIHEVAMEVMALARRYRLVLVPSSSFQLVLEPAGAVAAMARFFEHLEPGGTLILPWINIPTDYADAREDRFEREATMEDGSTVRRRFRGWFDPEAGLEHTDDQYEVIRDGVVVDRQRILRSPATRHYPRSTISRLHADAGFVELRWGSGFTLDPPRDDDRIVTTLARRPG
ncbi:MAG: class I SAM-dependent methyltransferase [Candidatus Limnocylindrales bacterium]